MNFATTDTIVRPKWQEPERVENPQIANLQTILFTALTTLILAYSGLFSTFPILIFYALWLPRAKFKGRLIPRLSKDVSASYSIAAVCILSVIWSYNRGVTLRAALELTSMVLCTVIAARVTDLASFIKGFIIGTTTSMIITLISGRYGIDTFTNTYSLVGLFGSKNQVGYMAEIGILCATFLGFTKRGIVEKTIFCLVPLVIDGICLYLCKSATSVASLLAVLAILFGIRILAKFPRHVRFEVLATVTFFAIILGITGAVLGWQEAGLHLFGKDTTLTGRTFLWTEGIKTALENPFLGSGFYAFWVPGQPEAEKLWFNFGIFTRSGFHFHNTYIHILVDMGLFGLLPALALIIGTCHKSLMYVVNHGVDLTAYFAVGMAFMFLIRSFVEVDLWGAFGIGIFIFYGILPRLALAETKSGVKA